MRIARKKREIEAATVALFVALAEAAPNEEAQSPEVQKLTAKVAKLENDLRYLQLSRLLSRAKLWRIFISPNPQSGDWIRDRTTGDFFLKPEAEARIQEAIFQRQVGVLGMIFGVSSIIQALYAVLSYYFPRR